MQDVDARGHERCGLSAHARGLMKMRRTGTYGLIAYSCEQIRLIPCLRGRYAEVDEYDDSFALWDSIRWQEWSRSHTGETLYYARHASRVCRVSRVPALASTVH